MNETDFWALIGGNVSSTSDGDLDLSALQAVLEKKHPDEIVAYAAIFDRLHSASYSWALWGAAYVINGGCGDDGFEDFRGWLIGQGQAVFEAALANPESLIDVAREGVACEEMLYVAEEAYEVAAPDAELPEGREVHPELGEGWDFDSADEMRARYPKLFAKFGG